MMTMKSQRHRQCFLLESRRRLLQGAQDAAWLLPAVLSSSVNSKASEKNPEGAASLAYPLVCAVPGGNFATGGPSRSLCLSGELEKMMSKRF